MRIWVRPIIKFLNSYLCDWRRLGIVLALLILPVWRCANAATGVEFTMEISDITYVVTKAGLDKGSFFVPDSPADPYVSFSFPGYEYSYTGSDGKATKTNLFTTPALQNSENGSKTFTHVIHKLFVRGDGPAYTGNLKWVYYDDDTFSSDTICEEQSMSFYFMAKDGGDSYAPPVVTCNNGSIQFGKFSFNNFVRMTK